LTDTADPTAIAEEVAGHRRGHVRLGRVSGRLSGGRALVAVLVLFAVALGLLLRLWVLGRQPVGSDEAVVGLMAREILHGHFFAFYWGQSYGGGEPYVVAAAFGLFGQSTLALGLTPVLLDAVAALLLWRIGRRLFGPAVGVAAAALFWLWPEVYVWQSTIEYGFRFLTLDCGLVCLLASLRLADGEPESARGRLALWVLLGASVGLGWWCSPEIAYYAIPSGVLLAWRLARRRASVRPVHAVAAILAAALGALPWLWHNVASGYPSLRATGGPDTAFGLHIRVLDTYVLPMVLGLRLRVSGGWLLAPGSSSGRVTALGEVLYACVLLVAALWLVRLATKRRALVVVGFVVLFPVFYAYLPETWFWQDGRYGVYMAPVAALVAVSAADAGARWTTRVLRRSRSRELERSGAGTLRRALPLIAVVVAGLALTITATTQLAPYRPQVFPGRTGWFTWRSDPDGAVLRVAHELEALGVRDAYAGYWLAYALDFESGGKLTASDAIYVRYKPYLREVESSAHPAWIFKNPLLRGQAAAALGNSVLDPGCAAKGQLCLLAPELESWLARHGIGYRALDVGDFVLVEPRTSVDPLRVLGAYGIKG
jgi:4-amino-4-deoxy-L-arabinose transferase-like glycosyltransferase